MFGLGSGANVNSAYALMASIPSPSTNVIEIGPVTLNLYGIMIALGAAAAVRLATTRLVAKGLPEDLAVSLTMWALPAGLIGARLTHVATDWHRFQGRWFDVVKIWEGGLGIFGGVLLGAAVGIWRTKKLGHPVLTVLDAAAPAIALAQAIGRWGNWFNQELFGGPTDLPWALEIDAEHVPAGFEAGTLFHPTFLYESIWNGALVVLLIWIGNRTSLRPGKLTALYLIGYSLGRIWLETLRLDVATEVFGVRINTWIYAVVLIVAAAVFRSPPLTTNESGARTSESATVE